MIPHKLLAIIPPLTRSAPCCAALHRSNPTIPHSSDPSRAAVPQVPYRGLFRTALGVVREEGPLCLWQGITPAVCRHIIYTGVRMNGYEWMRNQVREEGASLPVW